MPRRYRVKVDRCNMPEEVVMADGNCVHIGANRSQAASRIHKFVPRVLAVTIRDDNDHESEVYRLTGSSSGKALPSIRASPTKCFVNSEQDTADQGRASCRVLNYAQLSNL